MNIQCRFCHALHWSAERLAASSKANPKFGMCCYQGKVDLPTLHNAPPELFDLFIRQDPVASAFRQNILLYNNSLAMTSVGKTVDYAINQGGHGPYSYVLRGELIHKAGFIFPMAGANPSYSQLYIHDTDHAVDHRIARHLRQRQNNNSLLDRATLGLLQGMLHTSHPAVHLYRQALELTNTMDPDQRCSISLQFDQNCDNRRYNLPDATVKEIAVVVVGDGERITGSQDISSSSEFLILIPFILPCTMSSFFPLGK